MAKWLVLVNPAAGRSPVGPAAVAEALAAAGVEHDVVVPETKAQAGEVIRDAAVSGTTHFAVAGGDGTVNMAANCLLDLDLGFKPVLGILPAGTGCDLLRTFALPQDILGAARHLASDSTYDIDVVALEGSWGLRRYVNVAQVGVGAAAAESAVRINRRLGPMRYPMAFGIRLPRFPRARVSVATEKRTYEADALAVIMANAQFFAGGWNVAPRATMNDGVADIQIISARKSQAPALVPKVIKGTHLSDPSVRRFSAAEFRIETDVPWPLEADGDLVGNTPVAGRVVPAAIRLKI
jgi:YegS/Rv2252/BmrU family lipid kinase